MASLIELANDVLGLVERLLLAVLTREETS